MSERLREIKEMLSHQIRFIKELGAHDAKWLIEQAERVQELELDRDDWKEEARKRSRRWEESEREHAETNDLLNSIVKQNQRYKQALEFYADESNHTEHRGTRIFGDVFYDKGEKARQALGGNENE